MHVAACPEVAPEECATTEIPEHLHDQDILWFRLDPTLSVGLGQGVVASAQLPFDFRAVSVEYLTLDGEPYDPPYGDIHHRPENITGLTDATVMVRLTRAPGRFLLTAGAGSTLPLGRTEDDPYAAGEAGEEHQHMQLGTGTFVPLVGVDAAYAAGRLGALAYASSRLSFYESGKGYRAPVSVSGGLGPTFRATTRITLLLTAEGSWESAEYWSGTPYAGRSAVGLAGGVVASLSETVVLQAQARGNVFERTEHQEEEGEFRQPVTASVGVSWTFGKAE
ncbi:MAG: hypothetical protein FJ090_06450 [Deltaproteobacteria bacterium]|nr:hypothetical protein [Deltaproteobacteria bacterium]